MAPATTALPDPPHVHDRDGPVCSIWCGGPESGSPLSDWSEIFNLERGAVRVVGQPGGVPSS